MSLYARIAPTESIVLIPDWAYELVLKRGSITDLLVLDKMKLWFTTEQILALDKFSETGLENIFGLSKQAISVYSRTLGYLWYFSTEGGVAAGHQSGQADHLLAQSERNSMLDQLVKDNILDYLRGNDENFCDIAQSYSIRSIGPNLILLIAKEGILSAQVHKPAELRLAFSRDLVKELEKTSPRHEVAKNEWVKFYLNQLALSI